MSGLSCSRWNLSLWCAGSRVVAWGLSCPAACGTLVPWPGIEPVSLALEGRFFTTGPPGKSPEPTFEASKIFGLLLHSYFLLPHWICVYLLEAHWMGEWEKGTINRPVAIIFPNTLSRPRTQGKEDWGRHIGHFLCLYWTEQALALQNCIPSGLVVISRWVNRLCWEGKLMRGFLFRSQFLHRQTSYLVPSLSFFSIR